MSFFELGMLVCFGVSWPISVMKSYRIRTAKGKSLPFLLAIVIGYISGITHKLLYSRDPVLFVYLFNLTMVCIDLGLYFRNRKLDQLRDKAKACASLDPQSYEYQLARQQAVALKPRINAIEQTINLYAKQLENSAKYQALVSSGQATIDLKKMMPDPAEATALVDMIVEQTQDVSREIEDFGAAIDEGLSSFSAATNMNVFGADDEFEKLVAQERASSAAQQAAEQAAQKAAEDEIQKAVDAEIAKAAAQAAVKEEPQAAAQESAQDATDDAQEVCE